MARVIVTGGAGFIGSHLVKKLCDEKHKVYVIDSFSHYINPPVEPLYVFNVNYPFKHLL